MDKLFSSLFNKFNHPETPGALLTTPDPQSLDPLRHCLLHHLSLSFFCKTCAKPLCQKCKDRHSVGHSIQFSDEIAGDVLTLYQNQLKRLDVLRASMNKVQTNGQAFKQGLESGKQLISESFASILSIIKKAEQETLKDFETRYKQTYKQQILKNSKKLASSIDIL